jgi:hypothetical protein
VVRGERKRRIVKENAPDIINYMMNMEKLAVTRKSEFPSLPSETFL